MEKIEKIREEIKNANARIKEREQKNTAEADKIITAWGKLRACGGKAETLTEAERKRNDEITARIAEREQENKRDKLRAEILRENLKAAMFEQAKAALFEILQKYDGKPYGEKTREKIAAEMEEKTGLYMYISRRYSSAEIRIYKRTPYGASEEITAGAGGNDPQVLTAENKIHAPTEEEKTRFCVWYERARYTEPAEIDARIDEIIAAHKAAEEALKAYNAAAEAFNKIAPNKTERASAIYNGVPRI